MIATAAHCVFQQASNHFVDFKIRIYDKDGQSELKTVKPHTFIFQRNTLIMTVDIQKKLLKVIML